MQLLSAWVLEIKHCFIKCLKVSNNQSGVQWGTLSSCWISILWSPLVFVIFLKWKALPNRPHAQYSWAPLDIYQMIRAPRISSYLYSSLVWRMLPLIDLCTLRYLQNDIFVHGKSNRESDALGNSWIPIF